MTKEECDICAELIFQDMVQNWDPEPVSIGKERDNAIRRWSLIISTMSKDYSHAERK